MRILYVYAHPSPNSFNHLLREMTCEFLEKSQHEVIISDLYSENFNPVASWEDFNLPPLTLPQQYFLSQKTAYEQNALVSDIKIEMEKLSWSEHIIFQFPLWWFSAPAILKGWLDRVLVKGFAYDTNKAFSDGLLKGRTTSLIVTTQSAESAYQLSGAHACTIDTFLHPIHHTLRFVGLKTLIPFIIYDIFNNDNNKLPIISKNLKAYIELIGSIKQGGINE